MNPFYVTFLFLSLNLLESAYLGVHGKVLATQSTSHLKHELSIATLSISSSIQYNAYSTDPSHTSVKEVIPSPLHLGDYIAVGLGLSNSLDGSFARSTLGSVSTSKSMTTSGNLSTISSSTQHKTEESSLIQAKLSHTAATSVPFANTTGNFTFDSENCWSDWNDFWSMYSSVTAIQAVTATATTTETITFTEIGLRPGVSSSLLTYFKTFDQTRTYVADGYSYMVTTIETTETDVVTDTGMSGTTWSTTYTNTLVEGSSVYFITPPHINITTPSCRLPSSVPQCQSSWNEYASLLSLVSAVPGVCTGDSVPSSCTPALSSWSSAQRALSSVQQAPPNCTQASLNRPACALFYGQYISQWLGSQYDPDPAGGGQPPVQSVGYQRTEFTDSKGALRDSTYWPSSSILAPGCSIGCGECAITGGTVRLLYWPITETGPLSSAIARPSARNGPITAFAFGTSFVSPTVYFSYHNVYASDSCGLIGSTHGTTIIPLSDSAQLSSVWQVWSMTDAATAFFNYSDLIPPIPQSIYDRQPQCSAWTESWLVAHEDGIGPSSDSICPTTLPYAPMLGKRCDLWLHWLDL